MERDGMTQYCRLGTEPWDIIRLDGYKVMAVSTYLPTQVNPVGIITLVVRDTTCLG